MCESDLKGNNKRYDSEIGLLAIDRRDEKSRVGVIEIGCLRSYVGISEWTD